MLHLTEPELAALLGAGTAGVGATTRSAAHVAACARCAERLRVARQADAEVGLLLSALDAPVPAGRADTWHADALLHAHAARRRRIGSGRPWARAAAAAVLFAATGAAALPGSPVRTVLGRALGTWRPRDPASPRTPVPRPVPPTPSGPRPGAQGDPDAVAVTPGAVPFEVRFRTAQPTGTITLVLGGRQLVVRARQGAVAPGAGRAEGNATGVSYTVSEAWIDVDNTGATASYEIHVPDALPVLHVRAAGQVVFTKRGPTVVTTARRDGAGRFTARFTTFSGHTP